MSISLQSRKYKVETLLTYKIPGYRCFIVKVKKKDENKTGKKIPM